MTIYPPTGYSKLANFDHTGENFQTYPKAISTNLKILMAYSSKWNITIDDMTWLRPPMVFVIMITLNISTKKSLTLTHEISQDPKDHTITTNSVLWSKKFTHPNEVLILSTGHD